MSGWRTHSHSIGTLLRILAWACVLALAFLSLMPADHLPQTGFPGVLNHFVAYAGSCTIATAAYGKSWNGNWKVTVAFWVYAAVLEYLQNFVQRDPAVKDFIASAIGATAGGAMGAILWPRLLRLPIRGRRRCG